MSQILVSLFDTLSLAVDAKSALLAIGVKPAGIEIHTGPTGHRSDRKTQDKLAGSLETDRLERFFSRVFGREERPNEVEHFNEGIRRGGTLLCVVLPDESDAYRVSTAMLSAGATDIDEVLDQWRESGYGYKGYEPSSSVWKSNRNPSEAGSAGPVRRYRCDLDTEDPAHS
ncbi:hypothetical protein [Caballeronia sordidicola]|uniref:hypothetical protein n=1 Tax=Caballeronia sordidicola TaxID=196367 RepID=UPI00117F57DB|nr:hypothetical protein [Caballeronia sordidicola]